MTVDAKEATRALNGWARSQGYSDFDTYMAAGGTIREAMLDLQKRRERIDLATAAIYQWKAPPAPPPHQPEIAGRAEHEDYERANTRMTIGEDALKAAEAEVTGEAVEPDNAQIQGFEV